mgnify:CR=1 FL=1
MWQHLTKSKINEFILSLNLTFYEKLSDKEKLKLIYTISNHAEKHYKVFKIPKRNGGYRTIYEPDYTLKSIQRNILNNVLNERITSSYAKAYKKGLSLVDNATPHLNKKVILKLDIKDFFPSIDFLKVYKKAFPRNIYPEAVASLLTNLTTYNNFLPQGTPTSSYISNLVLRSFDIKVGNFCEDRNISYTRYCDDMTFSGDFDTNEVITFVKNALYKEGFILNKQKIKIIKPNKAQIVTGIVCNEKLSIPRPYKKAIRQSMYYINKYGLDNHLKHIKSLDDKTTYLNKLYGQVLFVLQIEKNNPEFLNYKNTLIKLKEN